jgi:hypothetical protein
MSDVSGGEGAAGVQLGADPGRGERDFVTANFEGFHTLSRQ